MADLNRICADILDKQKPLPSCETSCVGPVQIVQVVLMCDSPITQAESHEVVLQSDEYKQLAEQAKWCSPPLPKCSSEGDKELREVEEAVDYASQNQELRGDELKLGLKFVETGKCKLTDEEFDKLGLKPYCGNGSYISNENYFRDGGVAKGYDLCSTKTGKVMACHDTAIVQDSPEAPKKDEVPVYEAGVPDFTAADLCYLSNANDKLKPFRLVQVRKPGTVNEVGASTLYFTPTADSDTNKAMRATTDDNLAWWNPSDCEMAMSEAKCDLVYAKIDNVVEMPLAEKGLIGLGLGLLSYFAVGETFSTYVGIRSARLHKVTLPRHPWLARYMGIKTAGEAATKAAAEMEAPRLIQPVTRAGKGGASYAAQAAARKTFTAAGGVLLTMTIGGMLECGGWGFIKDPLNCAFDNFSSPTNAGEVREMLEYKRQYYLQLHEKLLRESGK